MTAPRKVSISEAEWLGGGKHSRASSKDLPGFDQNSPSTAAGSKEARSPSRYGSMSSPESPLQASSGENSIRPSRVPPANQALPTSPAKDTNSQFEVPASNRNSTVSGDGEGIGLHFKSRNMSRAGSIYSLSRVSFSNQISQLTSINLPEAKSLSSSVSCILNTPKAARALNDAADQIQSWIHKASDVLGGLDAGDDAEWAAAAGREGLGEVDLAISRFEGLVQVYVEAVEALQLREDASSIPAQEMRQAVQQVEKIVDEWQSIKNSLNSVKRQVELAMEWEELRDSVIQDIGVEAEALSRLVFEMEEERHRIDSKEASGNFVANVDIAELETIVEEAPTASNKSKRTSGRYEGPQLLPPLSPLSPASPTMAREDTNLLGLFARMQPLRASLDFLPMKLATFRNRANGLFPSACAELDERRKALEEQWKRLESDAESLRKELGEDRWLIVFRNAGKQALRLIDSVSRAVTKLDESLDSNTQLRHAPGTSKKIESYEAKKRHYCPAIERIIATIERGVKDRLTVNGEILRLQTEMAQRWRAAVADVRNMDSTLGAYDGASTQQLRDSVSSILSSDRSFLSSTAESRRSSSASSIGTSSKRTSQIETLAPYAGGKPRQLSSASLPNPATPGSRRHSSLPLPVTPASSRIPHKTPLTRSSAHESSRSTSFSTPNTQQRSPPTGSPKSLQSPRPAAKTTPTPPRRSQPSSASSTPSRPRWNACTNLTKSDVGHHFKPLSATEPSQYRKSVTPARPHVQQTPPNSASPLSRRTSAQFSLSPSSAPSSSSRQRRPSSLHLNATNAASPQGLQSASSTVPESPPTTLQSTVTSRPASSMTARNDKKTGTVPKPRSAVSTSNLKLSASKKAPNAMGGARPRPRVSSGTMRKMGAVTNGEV